jgi:hypothetical protein
MFVATSLVPGASELVVTSLLASCDDFPELPQAKRGVRSRRLGATHLRKRSFIV